MASAWCVGDWRGYVSAVGVALSGVAGDGVVVGIRNAEAEVLWKCRTVDRSILGHSMQCSTRQRVLPGICRHVTSHSFWMLDLAVDW